MKKEKAQHGVPDGCHTLLDHCSSLISPSDLISQEAFTLTDLT